MHYSSIPKRAVFERKLTGTNVDGGKAEVIVWTYGEKRYARFALDGYEVLRRQYSGKNLAQLDSELTELREGLHDVEEAGRREH